MEDVEVEVQEKDEGEARKKDERPTSSSIRQMRLHVAVNKARVMQSRKNSIPWGLAWKLQSPMSKY